MLASLNDHIYSQHTRAYFLMRAFSDPPGVLANVGTPPSSSSPTGSWSRGTRGVGKYSSPPNGDASTAAARPHGRPHGHTPRARAPGRGLCRYVAQRQRPSGGGAEIGPDRSASALLMTLTKKCYFSTANAWPTLGQRLGRGANALSYTITKPHSHTTTAVLLHSAQGYAPATVIRIRRSTDEAQLAVA